MNNGITTVKMGMPFKPNTMTQGNMFSIARVENTQYLQSEDSSKKWYGSSTSRSTSSYISSKRNRAIGNTSTMQGLPNGTQHSFKSTDKTSRNTALQRARAGGSVAPKKKGAAN
tara:strand:+ start:107 stop:448 length:342 start_codon:yes stop_codon:yes gene_type:complete